MIVVVPIINSPPQKHKEFGLDKLYTLLAKDRRRMCYIIPSMIAEVFLTDIKKLSPNAKAKLYDIQSETLA